jgi:HK97 family phage prohead protease
VLARGKTKTWLSGTVALVKTKGGGKPVVHVTASSDHEDLELDVFELSALKEMRDGFQGRLMFLNHNYQVPSDVFGMIDGAVLNKRGGNTFLDLTVGVETANPAAAETHAMIENGTRLGVSVGVIVRDAVKRDGGGFSIRHVTPLEVSIVGIPANQDAGWTRGG